MKKHYDNYIINKGLRPLKTCTKRNTYVKVLRKAAMLDTETSHNHNFDCPQCWIYQWAICFNGGIYYGRTPSELITFIKKLIDYYELGKFKKLVIFVHNLPYDFSYLQPYLFDEFGNPSNLLATANHKPFLVEYDCGISFRCSYKLSNKSLDKWGNDFDVKHKKLVDTIDYDAIHNQYDELTEVDWNYQFNDVICMQECIDETFKLYPVYTMATLPLTSTGFVRNEIKHSYQKNYLKNHAQFVRSKPTLEQFRMLNRQMSGGFTHGNRWYSGITIEAPEGYYIKHRDERSFYPTMQITQRFANSKAIWFITKEAPYNHDLKSLYKYIDDYDIYVEMYIKNLRLKDKHITLPYIQTSHTVQHQQGFKFKEDNGRVLFTNEKAFKIVLNLLEVKLINEQYDFDYSIVKAFGYKLDVLPSFMTDVIKEHFKGKSDLKDIVRQLEKDGAEYRDILEAQLTLMKSKNVLNGIYGCTATNYVKPIIRCDGINWKAVAYPEEEKIQEILDNYYNSKSNCLRYEWGCRTTTLARIELVTIANKIESLGGTFLYADTDSIFYISNDEIEKEIEKMNNEFYKSCLDQQHYIQTDNGKTVVFHQFEDEDDDIKRFRYLHSKCYAIEHSDGSLDCTIAGVRKAIREDGKIIKSSTELKSIDNLDHAFTFKKFGGTRAIYISDNPHIYEGNESAGGCIITATTKTISCPDFREPFEIYTYEPSVDIFNNLFS